MFSNVLLIWFITILLKKSTVSFPKHLLIISNMKWARLLSSFPNFAVQTPCFTLSLIKKNQLVVAQRLNALIMVHIIVTDKQKTTSNLE